MRRSITITLTMMLAVGMLAGFAGPVAAQDGVSVENSADATVDQDQSNTQASGQNASVTGDNNEVTQTNAQTSSQEQAGAANATADQGISVNADVTVDGEEPEGE